MYGQPAGFALNLVDLPCSSCAVARLGPRPSVLSVLQDHRGQDPYPITGQTRVNPLTALTLDCYRNDTTRTCSVIAARRFTKA